MSFTSRARGPRRDPGWGACWPDQYKLVPPAVLEHNCLCGPAIHHPTDPLTCYCGPDCGPMIYWDKDAGQFSCTCAPCNKWAWDRLWKKCRTAPGGGNTTLVGGGTQDQGGGGTQDQGGGGNQDQGGGGTQDQGGGGTQDQGTGDSDTGTQGQGGDAQDCGQPGEAPPPGKDCCEGGGVGPTGLCRQTLTGNRGQLGERGGILGTGQQGRVGAGTPPPVLPGGQGPYLPGAGGGGGQTGGGAAGGGGGQTGGGTSTPPRRTTGPIAFGGSAMRQMQRPVLSSQRSSLYAQRRQLISTVGPDGKPRLLEVV